MKKSFQILLKKVSILSAAFFLIFTISCSSPSSDSSSGDLGSESATATETPATPATTTPALAPTPEPTPTPTPTPQPTPVVNYTITFVANNAAATGSTASITAAADSTVTLTANGFSLEGYNFTGWNTAANGSGTGYSNGASIRLTGNITLYAQWISATVPTYTITVSPTENVIVTASQNIAESGTEITVTITPNELYVFESISIRAEDNSIISLHENTSNPNVYTFMMPEQNITIIAVFRYIAHSVSLTCGEHGTATVDRTAATSGTIVKVYIQEIEEFYVRGNCVVTDTKGNNINVSWFNGEYYRFTMPDEDVTINLTFNLVTYPVKFMYDKKYYSTLYIKKGEKANPITIPETITLTDNGVKYIYSFERNTGWYSDPECTQLFNFATEIVEQTNLYTKFIKIRITEDGIKRHKIKDMYKSCTIEVEGKLDNEAISTINQDLKEVYESSSNIKINLDFSNAIITELENANTNENAGFKNCKSLFSIILPQTITHIGEQTFSGCSSLEVINIPDSVTIIGENAFTNCSSLKEIVIPDSVNSIGKEAFLGCTSLKEISLSNAITTITEKLFYGCSSLQKISIPNSVNLINEGVFAGCSALKEITIPFVGRSANELAGETAVFGYIFGCESYNGSKKTPVLNSSTYYYIPENLYKVTILGGQIQKGAFYFCGNITSVILPEGLLSIEESTFSSCRLRNITIPESVICIGEEAFSGCYFSSITIPRNLNSINEHAFMYARQLSEINVDNNNPYFSSENGVMYNKDKTKLLIFPRNKNQNFVIPSSVATIGKYAFFGCKDVINEIPETVISIEAHAFSCSAITKISIPESIISLKARTFDACEQLTEVLLPNSLENIEGWVFYGCKSLKNITIPSNVSVIGKDTFNQCSNLENIVFEDTASIWKVNYSTVVDVLDSSENAGKFKNGYNELRKY